MIKTIGILRKIHLILPRHSLITIYKTFINPHLDYGDVMCVCVCACVRACVRTFTVKALSVWMIWTPKEQINESLHKNEAPNLSNQPLYFVHTLEVPQLNQYSSHFHNMRPSATIIRHRLWSTLHRESIYLCRQRSLYLEKPKVTTNFSIDLVLGKVLKKSVCSACSAQTQQHFSDELFLLMYWMKPLSQIRPLTASRQVSSRGYGDVICDRSFNESFHKRPESIQYNAEGAQLSGQQLALGN